MINRARKLYNNTQKRVVICLKNIYKSKGMSSTYLIIRHKSIKLALVETKSEK